MKLDYKIFINLSPKGDLKHTAIPFHQKSEITRVKTPHKRQCHFAHNLKSKESLKLVLCCIFCKNLSMPSYSTTKLIPYFSAFLNTYKSINGNKHLKPRGDTYYQIWGNNSLLMNSNSVFLLKKKKKLNPSINLHFL